MVMEHSTVPVRFVVITDSPEDMPAGIEAVKLWDPPIVPGMSPRRPNCYVRLRAFSREMEAVLGPRFMWLDVDCVIKGNIDHILTRTEPFIAWGSTARRTLYNGSMIMMDAGARERVWTSFDPRKSPRITRSQRMTGSDQAWISHILGEGEAMFTTADGVFSYRNHFRYAVPEKWPNLDDVKIVFFHGEQDPWHPEPRARHKWVRDHYPIGG